VDLRFRVFFSDPESSLMDIENIVDRIEIENFFSRYARAVDDRDWELYRTLFTEDAHIDYSSSGGSKGNLDETVSFLSKALDMFEMSQHLITNIELFHKDENAVHAVALFNNPMRLKGGDVWFVGGKYKHELLRSASGWKSEKLIEETLWFDRSPFGDLTGNKKEE
tara:strand:- start:723 stop:1220 length:498 start_codon:yes stop_codon:yes gene_type:complete